MRVGQAGVEPSGALPGSFVAGDIPARILFRIGYAIS